MASGFSASPLAALSLAPPAPPGTRLGKEAPVPRGFVARAAADNQGPKQERSHAFLISSQLF
jgi:hypothetical protein